MAKTRTPLDVVVLNTIAAAAADVSLSGGKLSVTGQSEPLKLVNALSYSKTAYAAGTLSVKTCDLTSMTILANTGYRLAVVVEDAKDFTGGGKEANQLIPIREYVVFTGSTAPSATALGNQFADKINADLGRKVNAVNVAGVISLTLISLNEGDFDIQEPTGATNGVTTPFVAPSGTPAEVEALAPNKSSATANYTKYVITFDKFRNNNVVSGGKVAYEGDLVIYADELAANFAAFETELDACLGGTHTPVADYLGV